MSSAPQAPRVPHRFDAREVTGTMRLLLRLLAALPLGAVLLSLPPIRESFAHRAGAFVAAQPDSISAIAQSLLDTDRRFAAAGERTDMVAALSPMFADGVLMPTPTGFAMGKAAVMAALRSSPTSRGARVAWRPVRAGISADGTHGFTFGYMAQAIGDTSVVPLKYMAYWVRAANGWRVLAYKRARSAAPTADSSVMDALLPSRMVPVRTDRAGDAARRRALIAAEQEFSDNAQRVGLGNAFASHGRADAVNMGGAASSTFVVGAEAIAQVVNGGDLTASPVRWSADTAFVASSDDLGVTFGRIVVKNPPPGAASGAGIPFFTIWFRDSVRGPWRYIAE